MEMPCLVQHTSLQGYGPLNPTILYAAALPCLDRIGASVVATASFRGRRLHDNDALHPPSIVLLPVLMLMR